MASDCLLPICVKKQFCWLLKSVRRLEWPFKPLSCSTYIILAVITALTFSTSDVLAQGQVVRFRHLTIDDGLSQASVRCLLQDIRGFMWFCTEDGVSRFDGSGFRIFRRDPTKPGGLSNNGIYSIHEDSHGVVWVGTGHGLNRFDRDLEVFSHFFHDPEDPNSLSDDHVTAIYTDRQGVLWVGTAARGLNARDPTTGHFKRYLHDPNDTSSLSYNAINTIFEDRAGVVWIGTDRGLNAFYRGTGKFESYQQIEGDPSSLSHNSVTAIFQDTTGVLWIGTMGGGLHSFDPEHRRFTRYQHDPNNPRSISSDDITWILEDHEGVLWIGTDGGGANVLDRARSEFYHYRHDPNNTESLSSDRAIAAFEDRSGVLWIGAYDTGVDRWARAEDKFPFFRTGAGGANVPNDAVRAFHVDRAGVLWVGSDGFGVSRVDRRTGAVTHYRHNENDPTTLSSDRVYQIHEDRFGRVWIGTEGGGLDRLDENARSFERFYLVPADSGNLARNSVRVLFEDRTGTLWAGTDGGGLYYFDRSGEVFRHYRHAGNDSERLGNNRIFSVIEDRRGLFWVGTFGAGLVRLDRETGRVSSYTNIPENENSLSIDRVLSVFEDRNGLLWIGTHDGGLNRFDPDTEAFWHYREEYGLPNNSIYGILEDDLGRLWMSHNQGISRFDPSTETFTNYDMSDGLQSNEFNGGSYYESPQGEMFFGGIRGYNAFFPNQIRDNATVPPVVLTDLKIFNRSVTIGGDDDRVVLERSITETNDLELSYADRVVSIEYAALLFGAAGSNEFAYIMEGFEDEWNYVGTRNFATYTNLPAGRFTFRVKASNGDGIWNEEGLALAVTVVPPFWKTAWFLSFVTLLVAATVFGLHHYRMRLVHVRASVLENKVKERTGELEREIIERKEVEKQLAAAHKEAVQATRSKSEFLANMSHEIRTPMNGVLGMARLVLDSDDLSMEHRDQVETIFSSGESLLTIINDILDFSKIEAGKLDIEPIPFDLQVAVSEVADLLAPKALEKNLELVFRYAPDAPRYLEGDAGRIRQIILNLAGNAIKFTTTGHVMIEVEGFEEGDTDGAVKISVHDTGIGMDEEARSKLFKPFSQADASTTRKFGGTGLGLAISRQLVGLMGGEIRVDSKPGEGSTFWFTMSLSRAPGNGPEAVPEEDLSGVRVLVVDDVAVNRRVLFEQLSNLGMEPVLTRSAAEGMDKLKEAAVDGNPFPLAVVDYLMPSMDGEEFGASVKANESVRDTELVLMTSAGRPGDGRRLQDAGFAGYLVKPARPDTLRDVLATIWAAKKEGKKNASIVTRHTIAEARAAKKPSTDERVEVKKRSWRVLVAEDNIVNQKVAQRMLEKLGCVVDVAANGLEAVDMWSKLPYGLVFMDCQMPEMDGYAATREIRKREGADRHTPVIAMTANAMEGDRDRCIEAGMDDYLPKPVRMDQCSEMLEKWAKSDSSSAPAAA